VDFSKCWYTARGPRHLGWCKTLNETDCDFGRYGRFKASRSNRYISVLPRVMDLIFGGQMAIDGASDTSKNESC